MDTGTRLPDNCAMRLWVVRLCLAVVIAVACGYLPYRASGGFERALRLKHDLAELESGNRRLAQQNRRLLSQISALRKEPRMLERVARDELGLVRDDEVVFVVR